MESEAIQNLLREKELLEKNKHRKNSDDVTEKKVPNNKKIDKKQKKQEIYL